VYVCVCVCVCACVCVCVYTGADVLAECDLKENVCFATIKTELTKKKTLTDALKFCKREFNTNASLPIINNIPRAGMLKELMDKALSAVDWPQVDKVAYWLDLHSRTDVSSMPWVWIDGSPLPSGTNGL